jgi:uncharacterized membrane protein YphA (DoxX/SURF4 family)
VGAVTVLVYCGILGLTANLFLRIVSVTGGFLLLAGLWTPVVGSVLALIELWTAFSVEFPQPDDRWIHLLLAILAGAVAMLGPGAWSIDARLFGRRRYEMEGRRR